MFTRRLPAQRRRRHLFEVLAFSAARRDELAVRESGLAAQNDAVAGRKTRHHLDKCVPIDSDLDLPSLDAAVVVQAEHHRTVDA